MSDEALFWRMEAQAHADAERVMLPRLGRHISFWGSGHSCDSETGLHDGPCVCECGIVRPYDDGSHDE